MKFQKQLEKKKRHKTHKGTIRMKEHLSETIQTRKHWSNIFKKLKERNKNDKQKCRPRFVYQDFYMHANNKIINHQSSCNMKKGKGSLPGRMKWSQIEIYK